MPALRWAIHLSGRRIGLFDHLRTRRLSRDRPRYLTPRSAAAATRSSRSPGSERFSCLLYIGVAMIGREHGLAPRRSSATVAYLPPGDRLAPCVQAADKESVRSPRRG